MDILAALKQEEAKLQKQLTGVRGAIVALGGARTVASHGPGKRAKRVVSAALRARLSKLAKERWARIKTGKQKAKKAA
jgi:predicted regulator of Ras-like GTPase activity (Roadblock/LC7/MglB family)